MLFSEKNTSSSYNDYLSAIEIDMKKKNFKYDIYAFDSLYTKQLSFNLLNLEEHLSKEHIDLYMSKETYNLGTIHNQWFALV